jgi:hypothetical protein
MTEAKGWPASKVTVVAVLAAGFAASVAINWPGHLSFDSVEQLWEGRIGFYNTWHPPVMAWLLGLFDAILPGAGLFVLFDAVLAFGTFFALLLLGRARWISAGLAALIVLLPQLLLYQGIVWKDVLFADAGVAAFVALAWVAEHWRGRGRLAALAMFAFLALAALARQNGVLLLPFAAAAIGWIARHHGANWRHTLLWSMGSMAVAAMFVAASTLALNRQSKDDAGPSEQIHVLALYDLAGAIAREPDLSLPILDDDDPGFGEVIRTRAAKLYTPLRNDPITDDPGVSKALDDGDTDALMDQWHDLMIHHLWLYLEVRTAAFVEVFATPDILQARPVFAGIEAPAPMLARLHMAYRRDARDLALTRYGNAFFGTVVWWHPAFAIAALASLVVLLRRRRPADIAMAALLASAFAFTASFFVISISCDYRYLYFLDLSALAALFYLSLDTREAV